MTNPEAVIADITEKLRVAREEIENAQHGKHCASLAGFSGNPPYPCTCWKSRALSAIDAEPVSPWRDIASAPRDGTDLLLFDTGERTIGYFSLVHKRWCDKTDPTDNYVFRPTLWRNLPPLPQPPVSQPPTP